MLFFATPHTQARKVPRETLVKKGNVASLASLVIKENQVNFLVTISVAPSNNYITGYNYNVECGVIMIKCYNTKLSSVLLLLIRLHINIIKCACYIIILISA